MSLTREDELSSLLPKNLTRFKLSNAEGLSASMLKRLPVTLTDFDAIIRPTHPDVVSFFHSETMRISLKSGPFSVTLNLSPFPTKLQYLRIWYINDDICAMIPPGLRVLNVDEGLITTKGASKMPKSLTSVTTHLKVFDNNEAMSYLKQISKIELSTYGIPISEPPNPAIISNLQTLLFESLHEFKNLNTLSILHFGGISSDWLCLVPQTVSDLDLSLSTFPTAIQLETLPTCLRYLKLRVGGGQGLECDWTDEILQSLPRSLHKFWINASEFLKLTQRMYEYLPPNLQESTLLKFIPPLARLYELS